ncbi:MAG: hypothetical protein FJ202_07345 [Gemmatimonadetes bacterium]|nr:hypothetical protein [Gemmatimonadota bacterium]
MRKLVAVAGLLAVMAGSAAAQGGGGGGGMGMGRGGRGTPEQQDSTQMARLFNGITLSADQMAKAKTIITAAREAMMNSDRQAPDFMAKMQEANAKRNADLKALLTSDADKAKFDENSAMGRGRRGGGF